MFRTHAPRALGEMQDYVVTYEYAGEQGKLFTAPATVAMRYSDLCEARTEMSFASFDCDFASPVTLRIKPTYPASTVDVRPHRRDVDYTFDGEELVITMAEPLKLSVEFDGDMYHNLFLFGGTPMEAPMGDKVRVFGPGGHHVGEIVLSDGETLYLDGDAVVFGRVVAKGDNITITGRGILTGVEYNHDYDFPRHQLCRVVDGNHVKIEGITMLDAPAWTLATYDTKDLEILDVRQICHNGNSDGLDICGCEDVLIDDCFLRNWDDNISLKAFGKLDNRNIVCRNTVMWTDRAHNMLVGPESRGGDHVFEGILFENIDVLEHRELSPDFMGVMAIFCADNAILRNITWRGIHIERMTYGRVFDFRYVTLFAESIGRETTDITMEDISLEAPIVHRSRILGLDEKHMMRNITIRNFTQFGRPLTADDPTVEINEFTENIVFTEE
ncbi:MAG: hypothetical protein IKU11_09620 [Clostridia bacterium]|nr:hypothetical protein [Clostridia bacterium]